MVVTNVENAPTQTTASGTELRVLMETSEAGQGRLSLAMETLKPGQCTVAHWHAHLEELYFIVSGAGRMQIGSETRRVQSGDTVLIPVSEVHCLCNTGDDDLVLLCPTAPPWYAEDFHAEGVNSD
jgi:mannose-6-phosphate isomerase-like protein (cupin superfamily)